MRKSRLVFTSALAFVFTMAFATLVHSSPIVTLETPHENIIAGNSFALNVSVVDMHSISDLDEIIAFGFDLNFDPSQFAYGGAIVAFPFLDDSDWFPGTDVAGSAFPGVSGDNILLASLTFTALISGNFSIGIVSDLRDDFEGIRTWPPDHGPIDMTKSISLKVSPVPEPATIALVSAGLAGLAAMRRQRKKG